MTVTLNLKPEVEAGLLAQAQANGMTLEEYLLSMVEGAAISATAKTLSPEERPRHTKGGRLVIGLPLTSPITQYRVKPCMKAVTLMRVLVDTNIRCRVPSRRILYPLKPQVLFPSCCTKGTPSFSVRRT